MRTRSSRYLLVIGLLVLSATLYTARWAIFGLPEEMLRYLLDDIAFVPVSVLLVTLVVDRVLASRERQALMHKLNMVVGAFFSEVGRPLIALLRPFDADDSDLSRALGFAAGWTAEDFLAARSRIEAYDYAVDAKLGDLEGLKIFLLERRPFMLGLLQNPNLLEHESFTELLWAVLHLQEELEARDGLSGLPDSDLAHLSGDIRRAYHAVLIEWLAYMRHLSETYPYLYSLALRRSPYAETSDVRVA